MMAKIKESDFSHSECMSKGAAAHCTEEERIKKE